MTRTGHGSPGHRSPARARRRIAPLVLALVAVSAGGCVHRASGGADAPGGASPSAVGAAPGDAAPIGTAELAALLADSAGATVLDVRPDVTLYLKSHLPGAVYLNAETLRASEGGVPNLLLPAASYATLFARLGVRADRPVVVYASGESRNIDATYAAWILVGMGHRAVRVLDGGLAQWETEGRPVVRSYPRVAAAPWTGRTFSPARATLADVRAALGRPGVVLVDARVPEQYAGEAGAQMRRGHIPGAVNHYWQDDLASGDFARRWKPRETIRGSYVAQGITADKAIIAYCNGGLESSHVYFTLHHLLGYPNVRVYDGSWTEWAAHEELPLETGSGRAARAPAR